MTDSDTNDVTDLRERILDATWHLMTLPGPAEPVTVTRVCGVVGCSPKALFHHFDSLDKLIGDTSARAFASWAVDIETAIGNTADPLERIFRRGEEYMRWGLTHPRAYLALFGRQPTLDHAPGNGFSDLLADLATAHDLAVDDPQVGVLGLAHWAGVHGLTCLAIARPTLTEEARMAAYHHLCRVLNVEDDPV